MHRFGWLESPSAARLPRDWPELRHDRPHRGQAAPDRLRLHQAHRRDRGELLSVMFASLLPLLNHDSSYVVRRRARATMAGVELSPVHLLPF